MTGAGTQTIISSVIIVVRHLGGLLCAMGPMVFLVDLSYILGRVEL